MKGSTQQAFINTFNIKLLSLFLVTILCIPIHAQLATIGLGWAKNSVNTAIFRKNAVVSFNNMQLAAYYDTSGSIILAKRYIDSAC